MGRFSLAEAIILALFQTSRFAYPLTVEQLQTRLLLAKPAREKDCLAVLAKLKKAGLVREENGFFSLVYNGVNLAEFKKRQKISRQKRRQIEEKLLARWRKNSLVRAVAMTGSVAINNARATDDIDFLIVTAPAALYLVRFYLVILSKFYGRKRAKNVNAPQRDQWCFNLWLTTESLCLPRPRQTLQSAYELLQADWVIDKDEIEAKIWQQNEKWLKRNLPNAPNRHRSKKNHHFQAENAVLRVPIWRAVCDRIAFHLQYILMRRTMTREIATRSQAFFHPRPSRIVNKADLIKQHQTFLGTLRSSGDLPVTIVESVARAAENKQVIVLVTGVFDLLHTGHLEFLQRASEAGDVLLVGVESNRRARTLKGRARPCRDELVRLGRIKQLNLAQEVFILPENFGDEAVRRQILQKIKPDILAVSARSANLAAKRKLTSQVGIEILMIPMKSQVSTSKILLGKVSSDQLLFSEDEELVRGKHGEK